MKPVLNRTPNDEEMEKITEKKNGKKIVGTATVGGKTIFFLEDGTEVIEDYNGNVLDKWGQ